MVTLNARYDENKCFEPRIECPRNQVADSQSLLISFTSFRTGFELTPKI